MRAKMNLKIQARGKEARDNLEALRDDLATHAADVSRKRWGKTDKQVMSKGNKEISVKRDREAEGDRKTLKERDREFNVYKRKNVYGGLFKLLSLANMCAPIFMNSNSTFHSIAYHCYHR